MHRVPFSANFETCTRWSIFTSCPYMVPSAKLLIFPVAILEVLAKFFFPFLYLTMEFNAPFRIQNKLLWALASWLAPTLAWWQRHDQSTRNVGEGTLCLLPTPSHPPHCAYYLHPHTLHLTVTPSHPSHYPHTLHLTLTPSHPPHYPYYLHTLPTGPHHTFTSRLYFQVLKNTKKQPNFWLVWLLLLASNELAEAHCDYESSLLLWLLWGTRPIPSRWMAAFCFSLIVS